jgi:uncharacterized protein (TIGR03083 family)
LPDTAAAGSGPDHVELLGEAVAAMAAALAEVDPEAPVPACPGWTVEDLATHLVAVHRWATAILLTGQKQQTPEVRRTAPLPDWYAATAGVLLPAVRAISPDEPCWNFAPVPQVAGFWRRRQLHETVVHTVDVVQAAGRTPSIDARLAADGVDEAFGVFLPRLLIRGFPPAVTEPVTVVSTDTDDVWTLTPVDGDRLPPQVGRTRGEALATISGSAADLYLACWKRGPVERLAIDGDPAVAARFLTGKITP